MKRFMVKCLFISMVLFLGVLLGMQQANEGMRKMKGYDDPAFQEQAFHVAETAEGYNGTILGRQLDSQDMKEKQEKLEGIKAYNVFSSAGKKLADGVSGLMSGIFNKVQDTVEEKTG